jgi:hypothetical protein
VLSIFDGSPAIIWYAGGTMSRSETLTTKELAEPVEILAGRFIQRFDKYPRQADNGSYFTVEKPLSKKLIYAHLQGKVTLGTYLLNENSQGRFMVLDGDDEPDRRRLVAMAQVLGDIGCPTYFEASRRGAHLWFFFEQPRPGEEIRRFGRGLMAYFNLATMELYPKQDKLQTGPGSLIRLPFGVHKKSCRRYGFYTPAGEPLAPTIREQLQVLRAPEIVPERLFEQYAGYVSAPAPKPPLEPVEVEGETVSDRIKAAVSCFDFISRYIELKPNGRGLCPFHDDRVASFSVNQVENYWQCFAGCGSGSIIDFYMRYQREVVGKECDFKIAITDLAEMLLK